THSRSEKNSPTETYSRRIFTFRRRDDCNCDDGMDRFANGTRNDCSNDHCCICLDEFFDNRCSSSCIRCCRRSYNLQRINHIDSKSGTSTTQYKSSDSTRLQTSRSSNHSTSSCELPLSK